MDKHITGCPIDRLFSSLDADRVDDLGFLDPSKTPKLVRFDAILQQSLTWIIGPPWLGKSKVASDAYDWLRTDPTAIPGLEGRFALTKFGQLGVEREVPPAWWDRWCQKDNPGLAVWLLDGVDEGVDRNSQLFDLVLRTIEQASVDHLRALRLILFSRPYAEMGDFQKRLEARIVSTAGSSVFWLARLDRIAAEKMVSADQFPAICDLIRRNNLQTVAGYPIVLHFLKKYGIDTDLSIPQVWRGVLTALLGERSSNPRVQFATDPEDRFAATCRIAGVLALTRRDTIREYSMDPREPTLGTLLERPDNIRSKAAQEAVLTAAFVMSPEQGAYRFTQRNVHDWFVAFAFDGLPLHSLRSALAGDDGKLVPSLRESARLLHAITNSPAKRALIDGLFGGITLPSDAVEPTLAAVCACLDQIEALATTSPWGLRGDYDQDNGLARLKVDGLGNVLATRLRDTTRSHRAKELLIEVVEATKALDAIDAAVEIVLDSGQDGELRIRAMILIARFGGDAHLRQLEGSVGQSSSSAEIESRLRGVLILELLNRGLWPFWQAALYAPKESKQVVDSRAMLVHRLGESITLEDARRLLSQLTELYKRHSDPESPERMPAFLGRVIELTAESGRSDDVTVLVQFALGLIAASPEDEWVTAERIARLLRSNASARHSFYQYDTEVLRSGGGNRRIGAIWLIMPEDWHWLRDQALSVWAGNRKVWEDAYWMARQARDQGKISQPDWDAFVVLVEEHAPGLPLEFEDSVRRHEEEQQRREAENHEHKSRRPTQQPLADRLNEILARQDLSDADRMRDLAWISFTSPLGVEKQAVGKWDDLPVELHNRVLNACRRGLELGDPTPIPQGNSFSGTILSEAAAFFRVSSSNDHQGSLDEHLIQRWLPTALFGAGLTPWTEVIRICWRIAPAATERALLEALPVQVRIYTEPFRLREVPSECWTESMTENVLVLVNNEEVNPRGRRELLEQLANRGVPQTIPIATTWAKRPLTDDDADQLRQGGRNVLLRSDPATVLALVEVDVESRGNAPLEELRVLWGWHDEPHVQWRSWPTNALERLGRILVKAYPLQKDPEYRGGFVTPDQELRRVRDELVGELLRRSNPESNAAIDGLSKMDAKLQEWVDTRRASEKAGAVLKHAAPMIANVPAHLSLAEATKILDRSDYRLIRSEDDLLDALVDVLTLIGQDVGHDLPMLFSAPDRSGGQQPRKHLEEDSLQSYLRRRLLERLPQIVDGVKIEIVREDQVSRRQRFDLRIMAPAHRDRRSIQVVLEVKWSDNDETKTSLVDQLGERYLRGEKLSHGVFLVGWCGEWSPGDGTGKVTDIEHVRKFLASQRDNYCRVGQPGNGLRIQGLRIKILS